MLLLNNLDLNQNELRSAKAHGLATDPPSPPNGLFWHNSTEGVFKVRLGGATVSLGALDKITPPSGPLSLNNQRITSLADPTAAQDAATKAYVDGITAGLAWKDEVRAATTANVALTGTQTVDGVALVAGDRVLVKNQTAAAENGIYVVAAAAWSRAADANTAAEVQQAAVFVMEGSAAADTAWVCSTNAPITLGTTALVFVKFAGGAAAGVNKFAANVGDGAATSIAVAHGLGSTDVGAFVYESGGSRNRVYPDTQITDANTVTLVFGTAPASAAYRCVVMA